MTIGRPFPGTLAYVLDRRQQPVPVGVPGELYLGGSRVASRSLDRPELTAEQFLHIRGFRSTAGCIGRVHTRCVAVGWQPRIPGPDRSPGEGATGLSRRDRRDRVGAPRASRCGRGGRGPHLRRGSDHGLAAMVVGTVGVDDLRRLRRPATPWIHRSSTIEIRDTLPRLVAGKMNCSPCSASDDAPPAAVTAASDDPVVARLCEIWGDLLQRPVAPNDNFFILGGHSLLAVRLFSLIDENGRSRCRYRRCSRPRRRSASLPS